MAGGPASAPDYSTGYRGLASSYRTRLFVAIVAVVAVVLGLVLLSLPRLLEGYFLEQEQTILEARVESVTTILAGELAQVSGSGAVPLILPGDDAPGWLHPVDPRRRRGWLGAGPDREGGAGRCARGPGPGGGPGRGVGARRGPARCGRR